jgi:hypothetical protein
LSVLCIVGFLFFTGFRSSPDSWLQVAETLDTAPDLGEALQCSTRSDGADARRAPLAGLDRTPRVGD